MPDAIKQKAQEEQERKRQLARLAELRKAIQTKLPERKIEWVEPKRHKPGERPKAVPLPNYTGGRGKAVPLPGNPNEPIRIEKLPYLFDTKPAAEEKTGVTTPKLSIRDTVQQQKAQAIETPALFDSISPLSKGLAKIMAISGENPSHFAKAVGKKYDIFNKRMGSTKDSWDLEAAAQNEKAAVIQEQGHALQLDIAPRSLTTHRSPIWEEGLLAAIPNSLKNGIGPLSPDAASTMTAGQASREADMTDRLTEAGQYGAAAKAGYQKLMSALFQGGETLLKQGLSALSHVEGAVSSAARVIVNAAKGQKTGAEADVRTQVEYDYMAEKLLGISPEAVGSIASFVGAAVGKDANARPDTAGLVSLLMETGAGTLGAVTQTLLEGEEQPLSFLQTLSRLFMLRKAATGETTDGDAQANQALTDAVSKKMAGAQVYTGHAEFDGIATVAMQSGSSMDTAQKRWGDAGINYFANLAEAGHSDIAAVLQTMPSYARAVVVAEQNMRTMAMSPGMLTSQLTALNQDISNPQIMKNAARRARLQAENGLIGRRIADGALGGLTALQKDVDAAQATHDKNLSALDQAGKTQQNANKTHAMASALFLKNPADSSAANGLSTAIDQMLAAIEGRKAAEQAVAGSQRVLLSAQYRLDTENQQAMGTLAAQVKKEIDQKTKDALKQFVRTGKTPLDVSNFIDKAEDKPFTLAQGNESGIIRADGKSLGIGTVTTMPGTGNVPFWALASAGTGTDVPYANGAPTPTPPPMAGTGKPDGQAAGVGNNPYSHMGISDADYQAYLDGKLTEDDLLVIANAASMYQAAGGSGNSAYMYQNEAHRRAADIRKKYDPDYIKNNPYDDTHGGKYNSNINEPMPGAPKYKVWTKLTTVDDQDGNQNAEASEEEQSVTPEDLLASVMTPERLDTLQDINDQFWDLLTDEQKQRIDNGESIFLIIPTLDEEKQSQIEQWGQNFLSSLDEPQKNDILFLGSGLLDGRDLETRQAILNHLKKNEGAITYEDLVDIGVFKPGTLSENGFIRWLQNSFGGPDVFADMLEDEYRLINDFGMTFGMADQEYRKKFEAQRAMAVTLLMAPIIYKLADSMVNGSAIGEFANNTHDNLERQGTKENSKGSQFSWNPPEGTSQEHYAAKSAGWKKPDGSTWWPDNYGFNDIPEKMTLQKRIRIDRYGNERGTFASPEGTPFDQRSLAPGSENSPYNTYEVIEPFDVYAGKAVPWFDQPGGGTQYQLPMSIEELRRLGYIRIITK